MTQEDTYPLDRRREPDLRVLQNDILHMSESLRRIETRLDTIESLGSQRCSNCLALQRVPALEEALTKMKLEIERSKGMAYGVGLVVSTAWAVVLFVVEHWGQ